MEIEKKLRAYAREKKNAKIKEEKLQQTIIKAKEEYWKSEEERNLSWIEFLYQQASYIQKRWWAAQGMNTFHSVVDIIHVRKQQLYKKMYGNCSSQFCHNDTPRTLEK